MKLATALKATTAILALIVITLMAAYFYIFRDRTLAISSKVPSELTLCEETISESDQSYRDLIAWLDENMEGWVSTPVTFVPSYQYHGDGFSMIVTKSGVVVNYRDGDEWLQFQKAADTNSIQTNCEARQNDAFL